MLGLCDGDGVLLPRDVCFRFEGMKWGCVVMLCNNDDGDLLIASAGEKVLLHNGIRDCQEK